ncbi:MAG: TRCF domain-containing protein, partial [Actinomycetota bacterium]
DHPVLQGIRDETLDRYGVLPDQVETLFAIGSLRITGRRLGVEEIATFRDQVRVTPVALPDALRLDLSERLPGATFHPAKGTLNLTLERVFGADLVRWVETRLREAVGEPPEPGLAEPDPMKAADRHTADTSAGPDGP